jgi:tRNA pseudouridine32 synthase/23S rRNA pseudouridine746 synthase
MERGLVVDEAGLRLNARSSYRAGSFIYYYREIESEPRIPFDEYVLHEDEHLLVIDKPHFVPVIPAGRFLHETLLVRLKKAGNREALVPLHRLDRETAGVVLFSLNPTSRSQFTSLFQDRKVRKVYEALAPSLPNFDFPHTRCTRIVRGEPFFRMKEVQGEPNSETQIDVIERIGATTRYRLIPLTGRKHQLRLHLAALGIPVLDDHLYPEIIPVPDDDFSRPLKLLAKSISFRDPLTGAERYFESQRVLAED